MQTSLPPVISWHEVSIEPGPAGDWSGRDHRPGERSRCPPAATTPSWSTPTSTATGRSRRDRAVPRHHPRASGKARSSTCTPASPPAGRSRLHWPCRASSWCERAVRPSYSTEASAPSATLRPWPWSTTGRCSGSGCGRRGSSSCPPPTRSRRGAGRARRQGIHDPAMMPFGFPWTDAPVDELSRNCVVHYWTNRASMGPAAWHLRRSPCCSTGADRCRRAHGRAPGACRTFETGSWLGRAFQGRGSGSSSARRACTWASPASARGGDHRRAPRQRCVPGRHRAAPLTSPTARSSSPGAAAPIGCSSSGCRATWETIRRTTSRPTAWNRAAPYSWVRTSVRRQVLRPERRILVPERRIPGWGGAPATGRRPPHPAQVGVTAARMRSGYNDGLAVVGVLLRAGPEEAAGARRRLVRGTTWTCRWGTDWPTRLLIDTHEPPAPRPTLDGGGDALHGVEHRRQPFVRQVDQRVDVGPGHDEHVPGTLVAYRGTPGRRRRRARGRRARHRRRSGRTRSPPAHVRMSGAELTTIHHRPAGRGLQSPSSAIGRTCAASHPALPPGAWTPLGVAVTSAYASAGAWARLHARMTGAGPTCSTRRSRWPIRRRCCDSTSTRWCS